MLLVVDVPTGRPPSLDEVSDRIREGLLTQVFPGIVVDGGSLREVRLPAGGAVEVEVAAQGHRGTVVFVPHEGESVDLVFLNGGSTKAQQDFTQMLSTLRIA